MDAYEIHDAREKMPDEGQSVLAWNGEDWEVIYVSGGVFRHVDGYQVPYEIAAWTALPKPPEPAL
jgi:hypothetical protein